MKHLRVEARVDPDEAPTFLRLIADAPEIEETRLVDWNRTREGPDTVLYAIDGDGTRFGDAAPETPGVESVELSATDQRTTYALVETRPRSMPMFDRIHRESSRCGLVVLKPIRYRDCAVYCRVVGHPGPLQASLDRAPDGLDVQITEIGSVSDGLDRPESRLSDRQRDAITTALEMGYYERPRSVTHADVADELGCSSATASEHLQKAEAKLVREVVDEFGPDV